MEKQTYVLLELDVRTGPHWTIMFLALIKAFCQAVLNRLNYKPS